MAVASRRRKMNIIAVKVASKLKVLFVAGLGLSSVHVTTREFAGPRNLRKSEVAFGDLRNEAASAQANGGQANDTDRHNVCTVSAHGLTAYTIYGARYETLPCRRGRDVLLVRDGRAARG